MKRNVPRYARLNPRSRPVVSLLAAAALVTCGAVAASAAPGSGSGGGSHVNSDSGDDDLMSSFAAFQDPRLSPSGTVTSGAYSAAWQHVQNMQVAPASYSEVTTQPLNSDSLHFRDHGASNSGGGAGFSAGRIAALATDPTHPGVVYAGGADGGVFRSADDGATWTPIADHLPALSVGALAVAPDGALWLATGEATTAFDNFLGSGVYRLADPATSTFSAADKVGGGELDNASIHTLRFDTDAGYIFAASSHGVFRRPLGASSGTAWTKVLAPCAGIGGSGVACGTSAYYADIANDVVVQPGSGGKRILANLAWRSGAGYNGFYYSADGGTTWAEANPLGAINPKEIGNATFAYSADGSRLYVVMESPVLLNKAARPNAPDSVLAGVYVSPNGDVNGPYNQIASSAQLASSGSAMALHTIGPGYQPGVQAWYDQSLIVDPADPMHVYMGLEELYESRDGGASWNTVGRYWNFGLSCFSYTISANTCDGNVMHSDQHALAVSSWPGRAPEVFVGNDGGAYARPVAQTAPGWRNLNASGTLRTYQYYSVGAGTLPSGGEAVWGGLQDNGVVLSTPTGATYQGEQLNPNGQMAEPFGGDGGDELVNPANGCQTLAEYTDLTMQLTNNCGYTPNDDGTPSAITNVAPSDPSPRFIAPFKADAKDPGYWVAGGEFVWVNTKTWASTSGADWQNVADSGAGHSITAVASQNHVVYAPWCGSCNPGAAFARGILTNYGGTWHQLALPANFPNRYIQGVTIDPADASGATAYVVLSGFSRHWAVGPGAAGYGHVWRTTDGGATWSDVSGTDGAADQLPDAPGDHILVAPDGTLVVATDLGVFTDNVKVDGLGHWKRLGTALPTTVAFYLSPSPDGKSLYIATHGRGVWKTAMP